MGSKKGSKETVPPEQVEINPNDVGQLSDVLEVPEAEAPEEAQIGEKIQVLQMGKVPDELIPRFTKLYNVLKGLGDTVDHSPASRRYHFKTGKRGFCVLFYSKTPIIDYPSVVEGQKKAVRLRLKLSEKGLIDSAGNSITQKELVKRIKEFKKARSL